MLANSALDRATALSVADPSLIPFIFDLITLGLLRGWLRRGGRRRSSRDTAVWRSSRRRTGRRARREAGRTARVPGVQACDKAKRHGRRRLPTRRSPRSGGEGRDGRGATARSAVRIVLARHRCSGRSFQRLVLSMIDTTRRGRLAAVVPNARGLVGQNDVKSGPLLGYARRTGVGAARCIGAGSERRRGRWRTSSM